MRRLGALVIIVAACAGTREVSKLRYTSTDCPDPNGCEAPLGEQAYQLPDENHDPVAAAAEMTQPPSCTSVAVALVALELGNYASEDEDRAAIQGKHHAACEAAKLDAREIACMSTVSDVKHVGFCTRKMGAPTQRVPMLSAAECRAAMATLGPRLGSYNQTQLVPIYTSSCFEDGWSHELAKCFVERGYYDPTSQCRAEAPGWVFDQLQARIDKQATATK